jgi:ABC-2 type transport system permease protein
MNKLILIIKREFIAKVRNKTFIIMTLLSPLLMIGMIALVAFLTKSSLEKKSTIAYVDESGYFSENDLKDSNTIHFENLTSIGLVQAKVIVSESTQDGLLFFPRNENIDEVAKNIQFFSTDSPGMVTISQLESIIAKELQNEKMVQLNVDLQMLEKTKVNVDINLSNFSGEKSSKLINGIKIGLGMGAGYMIMLFIIVYGAMVMRSVIEEKTSRIIEVIISSVRPFQLMLGKIFGMAAAGLTQFFIWGVLLFIGLIISSFVFGIDLSGNLKTAQIPAEQMEVLTQGKGQFILLEILNLPLFSMFILFIMYFLCGYLLYSSIYASIGAAVDNETDSQQFMLPVLMPLMIAVYVGFATVINDPHGTIATVFSMIPFTSPIVMLMRIPFGVPWWQILISLLILFITFLGVVWIAAKIYRVGILMYGKKVNYREIYKWLKY